MMRALLLKHLWTWHPRKDASVIIVLSLFFIFSLADCYCALPTESWFVPLWLVLIVSSAAGQSALLTDTKDGVMDFLSYLPIRRWQMWLANSLDCVATCLVVLVALLWHRLIFWHPPIVASMHDHPNPMELWLFGTRWAPFLAIASLMFLIVAGGMFWQSFLGESRVARILPAIFNSLAGLAIPAVMGAFHLVPSPWELATLLIPIGCVLWMAGLICFCWPPAYWGGWRRFAVAGLPCLLAVGLIGAGLLYAACNRWKILEPGEAAGNSGYIRAYASGDGLMIFADSPRSGEHLLYWDKDSESLSYLGRDLQPLSYKGTSFCNASRDRLCLSASFGVGNLWPCEDRLITIRRDGSDRQDLPISWQLVDGGRKLYGAHNISWTKDGNRCVFTATDRTSILFVADSYGRILKRMPIESDSYHDYLLSRSGRVLCIYPEPANSEVGKEPQVRRYRLYDIADDREREIVIRGKLLVASPDLQYALIARQDADSDEATIVKLSLDGGQETEVIRGEGLGMALSRRDSLLTDVPRLNGEDGAFAAERTLAVDPSFRHVVTATSRVEGKVTFRSFIHVDTQTMQKKSLIGDVPAVSARGARPNGQSKIEDYALGAFTTDGRAFVYGARSSLVWVELESGATTQIPLPGSPLEESIQFSPSGRRVAVVKAADPGVSRPRKQRVSEIFERGKLKLSITHAPGPIDWVDEDTLAYHTEDAIEILNINSGKKTRIDASMLSSRPAKSGSDVKR